jgi:hypothetical protein
MLLSAILRDRTSNWYTIIRPRNYGELVVTSHAPSASSIESIRAGKEIFPLSICVPATGKATSAWRIPTCDAFRVVPGGEHPLVPVVTGIIRTIQVSNRIFRFDDQSDTVFPASSACWGISRVQWELGLHGKEMREERKNN